MQKLQKQSSEGCLQSNPRDSDSYIVKKQIVHFEQIEAEEERKDPLDQYRELSVCNQIFGVRKIISFSGTHSLVEAFLEARSERLKRKTKNHIFLV